MKLKSLFINKVAIFFTIILFSNSLAFASYETIQIQLYANQNLTAIECFSTSGYFINSKEKRLTELDKQGVKIELKNNKIDVTANGKLLGHCNQIKLAPKNKDAQIVFKVEGSKDRTFDGTITITIKNNALFIINTINRESYIAGVVESEAGVKNNLTYSKLQAIICRTYAIGHLNRHKEDGFHLCDQVHCQVYNGVCTNADIMEAVKQTAGLVIVDEKNKLISAAFHSNCGGETANSEDVWASPVSYLKSVKDTFCLKMPNAQWEKKIGLADWVANLDRKYNHPIMDVKVLKGAINFEQPTRKVIFNDDPNVKLKNLRTDFDLRSTFFSVKQVSDSVLLTGRGYGHGVGLCQEGAMRMSQLNYSVEQIVSFYYKNCKVVSLKDVK